MQITKMLQCVEIKCYIELTGNAAKFLSSSVIAVILLIETFSISSFRLTSYIIINLCSHGSKNEVFY